MGATRLVGDPADRSRSSAPGGGHQDGAGVPPRALHRVPTSFLCLARPGGQGSVKKKDIFLAQRCIFVLGNWGPWTFACRFMPNEMQIRAVLF